MGYQAYSEYKESGVAWLGKVPTDWEVQRLKFVASHNDETLPENTDDQYVIEYVDISSVDLVQGITSTENMPFEKAPSRARRVVRHGDTLVSTVRTYLKAIAAVSNPPDNLIASTGFTVIRANNRIDAGFLACYLQSQGFVDAVVANSTGVSYPAINSSALVCLSVAYPADKKEQAKIAQFLDHKTAQIDHLIEKKQELFEKLQEQRIATITHAVNKGLDSKAAGKDSGVEWIGEVPSHWTVCKLSFKYSVELGKMLDEKRITGDHLVPYLRNQDVQWGVINTENLPEMDIHPQEASRFTVKAGDLLVCEGGDIGRAAIWRHKNMCIGFQKALHRLRPYSQESDTTEFFYFALIAAKHRGAFDESDTKATIAHLPAEKFRQFRFAFPPLNEQISIAQHLRAKTERLDAMLMNVLSAITRLHEYRTALITAAVTGQIDVRDWQAPEPTKEPADKEVA